MFLRRDTNFSSLSRRSSAAAAAMEEVGFGVGLIGNLRFERGLWGRKSFIWMFENGVFLSSFAMLKSEIGLEKCCR